MMSIQKFVSAVVAIAAIFAMGWFLAPIADIQLAAAGCETSSGLGHSVEVNVDRAGQSDATIGWLGCTSAAMRTNWDSNHLTEGTHFHHSEEILSAFGGAITWFVVTIDAEYQDDYGFDEGNATCCDDSTCGSGNNTPAYSFDSDDVFEVIRHTFGDDCGEA